jgi:hypothetical protein
LWHRQNTHHKSVPGEKNTTPQSSAEVPHFVLNVTAIKNFSKVIEKVIYALLHLQTFWYYHVQIAIPASLAQKK